MVRVALGIPLSSKNIMLVPTFRMQILLSLLCSVYAFDLGAAAAGVGVAGTAAAMARSYYDTPLRLRGLPSEESAFAIRECVPSAKGRGLFALKSFKTGEDVIEYRGALLSYKALAERYGFGTINLQGRYVFELRETGLYIDAGDEATSGRARFLNPGLVRGAVAVVVAAVSSLMASATAMRNLRKQWTTSEDEDAKVTPCICMINHDS